MTNDQHGQALVPAEQANVPAISTISPANISELDNLVPLDVELISAYWSPGHYGEKKRLIFDCIRPSTTIDQQTGDPIELECAFFWEHVGGSSQLLRNGSKRLVGGLTGMKQFTPLEITYKGKKKNATNSFSADDWSVKILGPGRV